MLATSQRRHTVQVFQIGRGTCFRVKVNLPTGQCCSKAEMEIGFTGTVLFSCKSQGFGDPVRRNRTPSLNESGRSLRNARRDFRRARRSLPTDIKGRMIAKRDIIYENNEGWYDWHKEGPITYLAIRKLVVLNDHPFRNSQNPAPMQTYNDRNDSPWMRLGHHTPKDKSVSGLRLKCKDIGAHQDAETTLQTTNNFLQKKLWIACRSCRCRISFKIS